MATVPVAQANRYSFHPVSESSQSAASYAFSLPKWSHFSLPPAQFPLIGEIAPGWVLIQPLPLTLERDDGSCIISDDRFLVYGDGDTPAEALQDYIIALIGYYEILSTRVENDPPTRDLFHRLCSYLRPTT